MSVPSYFYSFSFVFVIFVLGVLTRFLLIVWWAWLWLGKEKMQMNSQYGIFLAWANHAVFGIHTYMNIYYRARLFSTDAWQSVLFVCNSLIYACVTKLTFPFTFYHVFKASGVPTQTCLFYTFRQGGYFYIHTYVTAVNIYVCRHAGCVCVCVCEHFFPVLVTWIHVVCYFRLLFSNEVACAAPKTVIHFLSKVAVLFA